MIIEHPHYSGFPFIELNFIKNSETNQGVVVSSPVELEEKSFFQILYESEGKLMCENLYGRSDKKNKCERYILQDIRQKSLSKIKIIMNGGNF